MTADALEKMASHKKACRKYYELNKAALQEKARIRSARRRAAMKASTSLSPPTFTSDSVSRASTPPESRLSESVVLKASTSVSSPRLPDSDSDSQDEASPETPCRVLPEVASSRMAKYPTLGAPFKRKIYSPPERPLQRNLFGPKKVKPAPAFTWDTPWDDLDGNGLHPWQRMGLRRPSTYRPLEPYVATDRMPKNNRVPKFK